MLAFLGPPLSNFQIFDDWESSLSGLITGAHEKKLPCDGLRWFR